MRTALFLIFLALMDIATAITNAADKISEKMPDNVMRFFVVIFWVFIAMDIVDFFRGKKE